MVENDSLKGRIEAGKITVNDKYAVCKVAAKRLAMAHKALFEAEERKNEKNTSKAIAAYTLAEAGLNAAINEYASLVLLYEDLVESVLVLYDELMSESGAKAAKKLHSEAEKFENAQNYNKMKLAESVSSIKGVDEALAEARRGAEAARPSKSQPTMAKETVSEQGFEEKRSFEREEPSRNASREHSEQSQREPRRESHVHHTPHAYAQPHSVPYTVPYYMPPHDYYYRPYPPQPSVNIAPASIDISEIVEDAVASAMEKFKSAFARRADRFIENIPTENAEADEKTVTPALSSTATELEGQVLESESAIVEKLSTLMESIKTLTAEMTELGAAYIELASAQRDAVDAQRRVNDMQRALSRELQGVQANQKVINQDQAAVSGEQAALSEQQKASVENQKLVTAAQGELADMQKNVISAQAALEESMRELIATQKGIIQSHQSIIGSSARTVELQRELTERQSELNSLQKSAMSEHKQLARALRNKAKAHADKKELPKKEEGESSLSQIADNIVENAELPEEVVLDELKVED